LKLGGLYAKLYELQIGKPMEAEILSTSPAT
jgi:hypothetical protein